MKKFKFSMAVMVVLSSLSFAEGDAVPMAADEIEQDYWYIGVAGIYQRTYSVDSGWFNAGIRSQDETGGLTGILGYNFNDYLAFEGRLTKTLFKEDYADSINYGLFVKPQYRFWDDQEESWENLEEGYFSIYALLGYGVTQIDGIAGNTPGYEDAYITDDSSFQWGLGLSFTFADDNEDEYDEHDREGDVSIFVEYNSFMSDRDINARLYVYDPTIYEKLSQDGISAGVNYRF
ncbi:MAG: outer membrane beta-barrel protein [Campylobacterota bacterium]|nr:outer membrane beta-barrel protein [Campylobacterota bacterium]